MRKDMIITSTREMERLRILQKVMERRLTQVRAVEMRGVTDQRVRRILGKVREKKLIIDPLMSRIP
jgi:transcription initiation factor IIE alpha subunit